MKFIVSRWQIDLRGYSTRHAHERVSWLQTAQTLDDGSPTEWSTTSSSPFSTGTLLGEDLARDRLVAARVDGQHFKAVGAPRE
jgi:hypothetical protein